MDDITFKCDRNIDVELREIVNELASKKRKTNKAAPAKQQAKAKGKPQKTGITTTTKCPDCKAFTRLGEDGNPRVCSKNPRYRTGHN